MVSVRLPLTGPATPIRIIRYNSFAAVPLKKEMYWVIKWCFEWWLIVLFHALPVFFIEYCHKLCIQRQMVVRWKHLSYFLYGKYLKRILIFPLHIELYLKTLLCELNRQTVEAWQNGKHYSKGNDILASVSFWPLLIIESVARVSQQVFFTHELLVKQVWR